VKRSTSYLSFILVSIFAVNLVWQTIAIVHFYANQKEIEENFCVNLDSPELNCHGKCHLNKTIKVTVENSKGPLTANFQSTLIVFHFYETMNEYIAIDICDEYLQPAYLKKAISKGFLQRCVVPPELIA
jgi:hypothetical protein